MRGARLDNRYYEAGGHIAKILADLAMLRAGGKMMVRPDGTLDMAAEGGHNHAQRV